MPTLPATLLGAPVWLVMLAVFVLVAVPGLVAFLGWLIARRAAPADLPQVLLGLSHVISAFCGLLPWGKPSVPPALLKPGVSDPEPSTVPPQTLVVMRNDVALRPGTPGGER
ncbi:hypothetical protein [Streptomyces sp. NRRL S-337]|uniref:hypothetical protein n=1 Tax=Streptomyces sp. NRRL S-337 TaxID=1463900 RepID=UPI0004C83CF4|nr:hypothetical protein [Streptomyces sp. NRRL S-337]